MGSVFGSVKQVMGLGGLASVIFCCHAQLGVLGRNSVKAWHGGVSATDVRSGNWSNELLSSELCFSQQLSCPALSE